jgi:hypothetical protein
MHDCAREAQVRGTPHVLLGSLREMSCRYDTARAVDAGAVDHELVESRYVWIL